MTEKEAQLLLRLSSVMGKVKRDVATVSDQLDNLNRYLSENRENAIQEVVQLTGESETEAASSYNEDVYAPLLQSLSLFGEFEQVTNTAVEIAQKVEKSVSLWHPIKSVLWALLTGEDLEQKEQEKNREQLFGLTQRELGIPIDWEKFNKTVDRWEEKTQKTYRPSDIDDKQIMEFLKAQEPQRTSEFQFEFTKIGQSASVLDQAQRSAIEIAQAIKQLMEEHFDSDSKMLAAASKLLAKLRRKKKKVQTQYIVQYFGQGQQPGEYPRLAKDYYLTYTQVALLDVVHGIEDIKRGKTEKEELKRELEVARSEFGEVVDAAKQLHQLLPQSPPEFSQVVTPILTQFINQPGVDSLDALALELSNIYDIEVGDNIRKLVDYLIKQAQQMKALGAVAPIKSLLKYSVYRLRRKSRSHKVGEKDA